MEDSRQIINFAPSSSSSVTPLKKYDVFLSFRGDDTRVSFTSHLYDALSRAKVKTYIDSRLEKGDGISQALIKAIQDSLVSVVIFSENYATSKWCLDEISVILECKRDHGQIVIPVFYNVDPSDVRNQTGSYMEAFAKHEKDLKMENSGKLQKWKCALSEAANLGGWDLKTYRTESTFIKDIVKDILKKLVIRYPIELLKGVVGIEENYKKVESLLEIGSTQDIRVIGIWGMGGIGKTTLACVLYANLFYQFEGHCFLDCVREQSEKSNGIDILRNRLLSESLDEKHLCEAPYVKSQLLTTRLRRKKMLIVLDDVATPQQLEYLIHDYDFLAPGSRVIVTTRDKHIFSQVNGSIHEVKELSYRAALQFFCLNAFKEKLPIFGYERVLESVITYCKGNPLALKVLSSRLRSRSIKAWEDELEKLQRILDKNIHEVLKLSFDGLDRIEQSLFLDIACFFKGECKDQVTSLLDACGFYPAIGILNLIDKSLITISSLNNTIQMHDLIQEMGWEIVRQDSIKHLGSQSRLWYYGDVHDVLMDNEGTKAVEGIVLDVSKIKDLHLNFNPFKNMSAIRILKFYSPTRSEGCKIFLPNGLDSLSSKLRLLEWHGYCLESLPSSFCAEKLVKLAMSCSNIKKLWNGILNLKNLKEIDLSCSKDLVELPNLSQATRLEVLCLVGCINLREVHPSILSLGNLWNLDLHGCTKIESLESEVHSKSLRVIRLSNCSSLKKFSVFSNNLEKLWLDGTVIHELPTSIWRCEKLEHLSLSGCDMLGSLGTGSKSSHDPVNASLTFLCLAGSKLVNESNLCLILDGMTSLTKLVLEDCCNLGALPDSIGSLTSLEWLDLSGSNNVDMLSPNIKNLLKLEVLWIDNCRKLVSLPELPPSLEILKGINCTSLQTNFNSQLLPVVNRDEYFDSKYVILPGSQIPDKMFMFRGEGDSITFPQLPHSGNICRFICCIILPYIPDNHTGLVECRINEHYSESFIITLSCHASISDHWLLFSTDSFDSLAYDPNSITFEFSYKNDGSWNKIEIKRCGFFPVYASQDQQQTIPTVLIDQRGPSFKKEEGSSPEKQEKIVMEDKPQVINFASSSSSSVMPLKKYDVFLSFRGEDTRDNFISHLYDALQKEVETYIDNRLEKGDEISQALIKAIQGSHVSVVIFSENYASSKWCLDEISMILECKRDHGQVVIPVFYKVDPSDVRNQTGSYKEAFAKHEQDLKKVDKLEKWRLDLRDAANLAGWDSRTYRNESEFIKDIIEDVLQKLNIRYPIELKGVIGIERNYTGVESLLEIGSREVRIIGIWGMGGIGKTTLALALHAKLYSQFEGHCFLASVREKSEKFGVDVLRNRLFSELLEEENLRVEAPKVESHFVSRRLRRKKVLIVLDDVATSEQLEDLISDYDCLAPGSRVIVTTRDKHIFSQVNGIYEVKELNNHDSLQLFCLNAFREKQPEIGYEELSESVIAYCKGNPLALKVLGARLRSRSREAWKSEVRKLQKIPDVNIHNVMKLSFDGLDSD